jgi:pimeloyl-ACP methyl ester carboxylesterase
MMDFPLPGPGTDQQQLRAQLWWFGFHDLPQLPEQLVQGRQQTYLGWFYDNLVAPPNRLDAAAVTEYVRSYCQPSVLHGGFQLYRAVPVDAAANQSLTTNKLTLPILLLSPVRSPDPDAQKAQMIAVVQPMASGPTRAELVPDSGHFLAEENPTFVTAQLRTFIDANA